MKFRIVLLMSLALAPQAALAQSGSSGYDGSDGKDQIITAAGPVSITLNGESGSNGSSGSDGRDGRCNSYTNSEGQTVNDDVAGGDGDNGGNGGDGGDGGDLTVLFTNIVELKNIHFVSRGGYGGYGASGGRGGSGCPRGDDGSRGSDGYDGKKGNLYLVSSEFHPYLKDTSNEFTKISDLMKGKNIVKNIWDSINAVDLVAPKSEFGKGYILKAYEYGSAQVVLKDASKIDARLLSNDFQVHMSNGVTKINPNFNLMMVARHSEDSADAVLEIERLYSKREFQSLGFETIFKKNNQRFLHMTTDKDLLPRPTLTMKLKIEVRGRFFRYNEVFNDEVPAALIETLQAGYAINLDQLALKQKIPSEGKIRLTLNYQLQELDLSYKDEEVWVVKMKHVGAVEAVKEN